MYDDRRLTGGLGADGRDEAVGKEEAMQKETVYEAVGKEEAMQKEAMPEETVRGEAARKGVVHQIWVIVKNQHKQLREQLHQQPQGEGVSDAGF